jgi:catechol 1,2-dioxygenase
MNLRERVMAGSDGMCCFNCLRPVPYPVPYDRPAGKILQALERHAWNPVRV